MTRDRDPKSVHATRPSDADGPPDISAEIEDRFVWPPRPLEIEAADTTASALAPEPPASPRSPRRNLLRQIERTLARPTIEPIARQAAERDWQRDPPDAYCARCARSVGPAEEDEFGCSECRSVVLPYSRVVRLGEYADPLDRWIWALKFQRLRRFGEFLGRQLGQALEEAGALHDPPPGGVAIQPVPASRRRRIVRGIDHASVLAASCAARLQVPMEQALTRAHRPSQRSVPPSMRWENARGSIGVKPGSERSLTAKRIILIDDVLTSGATARSAALALQGRPDARYAPAIWGATEVWHATVARAQSR